MYSTCTDGRTVRLCHSTAMSHLNDYNFGARSRAGGVHVPWRCIPQGCTHVSRTKQEEGAVLMSSAFLLMRSSSYKLCRGLDHHHCYVHQHHGSCPIYSNVSMWAVLIMVLMPRRPCTACRQLHAASMTLTLGRMGQFSRICNSQTKF